MVKELFGGPDEVEDSQIVEILNSYRLEAVQNRQGGPSSRDEKWEENLNLYWNRFDFSKKADWQSKEVLPEVPGFVDRFAAALKEAIVSVPEGFYTVVDPTDKDGDLAQVIKRIEDAWLSVCGENQNGHPLSFPAVFEEQVKLGAMMACCAAVTWKTDHGMGRVAIESVDPRTVWLDHTYRNLYRVRRMEIDRHKLVEMAERKDRRGRSIFNLPGLHELTTSLVAEEAAKREALTGVGQQVLADRKPITLDEYKATVVTPEGQVVEKDGLFVVANEKFLIRGPEKNPFWHGHDWLIFSPLVTVPFSVYGRSYMDDFGCLAKTFNEMTNLILDATRTSALKAFALVPSLLLNPEQAEGGLHPNKTFLLEEGQRAGDFFQELDLGTLPAEAVRVWQALKSELTEGAKLNEIGLGQFAPKSRTSATEVAETMQNSGAAIRSVAKTIEVRFLDQCLDLVWKTGLQHASIKDKVLMDAAGPEMFQALFQRRKELVKRPITFQARGISMLIQRSQLLRSLMGVMQVIGSSEVLVQEFLKTVDMGRLIKVLFELSGVDLYKLQASEREKLMRAAAEPLGAAAEGAAGAKPPSSGAAGEVQDVVKALGVG